MPKVNSSVQTGIRIGAAAALVALGIILTIASGPMRAGWGFVGSAQNAGSVVASLMKDHAVQLGVANKLESNLAQSVPVEVAKQINSHKAELTATVVTLMNNETVQNLIVAQVQSVYEAVAKQQKTVLNFAPIVDQVTQALHLVDSSIPAKIKGSDTLNVTFNPQSTMLSNVSSLGSGSVVVWLIGLMLICAAIFALIRSRMKRFVVAGAAYLVSAILLIVMGQVIHGVILSQKFHDPLAKEVASFASARFANSLTHSAILDIVTGVIVMGAVYGVSRWKHISDGKVAPATD